MKKSILFTALLALIFFGACSKGEDTKEPEPEPEPVSEYFISFKYNGVSYEIRSDKECVFSQYGDDNYKVTGVDAAKKNAIAIIIAKNVKKGDVYTIYTSSPYIGSAVQIMFSSGETIAEYSYSISNIAAIDAIGSVSVSEKTSAIFSGTFSCKMMKGDITEGKFRVKESEYETIMN